MPGQSTRHGLARDLPDLEKQIEVSANSGLRQHAAFNAGQRTSGLGRGIREQTAFSHSPGSELDVARHHFGMYIPIGAPDKMKLGILT